MTFRLRVLLQTTPAQDEQLLALQRAFVNACNALAPLARDTRVWGRVGLHQLGYRRMRDLYPELGSQMVCNAIYSVSRACRLVYQNPSSPFNVQRLGASSLPLLKFSADAPVYFDRHTLSVRSGRASMFTLDGRIRFNLPLAATDEQRFREARLLEIMMVRSPAGLALTFTFADEDSATPLADGTRATDTRPGEAALRTAGATYTDASARGAVPSASQFPEYLLIIDPQDLTSHPSTAISMPLHAATAGVGSLPADPI